MSYSAYQKVANIPPGGDDPAKVEAWALTQAAQAMMEAQRTGNRERVQEAVRLNWRLWTIFQAELSAPDSTVPEPLRIDMLRLCNFVDQRSVDVLHSASPEDLTVLITINKNIADGQASAAAAPVADAGLTSLVV